MLTSATPTTAISEPTTSAADSNRSFVNIRASAAVTIGPNETKIATLLAFV